MLRLSLPALRSSLLRSFTGNLLLSLGVVWMSLVTIDARSQMPISGKPVPSLSQLDTIMQTYMAQYNCPGASLAVTVDGRLVFARGYGYAKVDTGEFAQPDSLYRIASNSKPITAAGIYKLIEQGKLSLTTQPFQTILNNLTPPPGTTIDPRFANITIQDLLQHTAGFDDTIVPDPAQVDAVVAATTFGAAAPATPELLIKYILGQPLQHDPGTTYAYSNLGYITLGYIIEVVSGEPYAQYIHDNVFALANIVRTQPGATLLSGRLPDEVAYYDYPGAPLVPSVEPPVGAMVPYPYGGYSCTLQLANGCWVSSTLDLLRFTDSINGQFSTSIFNTPPSSSPFRTPQFYFAVPPSGPGWEYIFYGSLPGTNSLTHLFTGSNVTGKVTYSAIFNTRDGSNIEQPESDADNAIKAFVTTVPSWPTGDLFPNYTGTAGSCSFTLASSTQTAMVGGSTLSLLVTDANYCAWSAVSNASWIHVTAGALNSDTGTVGYTVDANTGAARSGTIAVAGQTLTVTQNGTTTPTTLALASSATTATTGQPVTLTATLTPFSAGSTSTNGETVTFSSGATALGSATLTNGVATLSTTSLPVGSDGVTASYPGDTNFSAANAAAVQVIVSAPSQTTTTLTLGANPASATTGQAVTLTATLSPYSAQGSTTNGETITFLSGGTAVGTGVLSGGVATLTTSSLPVGTDTITATYAGDTNYKAASAPSVQVVVTAPSKTTTALTLAASSAAITAGQTVTLTATLAPFSAGSNSTNGEAVSFTSGGATLGTALLTGGVATLTTATLPTGTDVIAATYAGDTNFSAATAAAVQVVVSVASKTTTALVLTAAPAASTYGQAIVLTATLAPFSAGSNTTNGGTVTFSNGGTALGTGILTGGMATLTTSALLGGTDALTAAYAGDTNFTGSNAALSVTVAKAAATVALGSLSATYSGSAHPATATTTPSGLNVGLTYNGAAAAPVAAGAYAVVATIADPNYSGTATGTLTIAKAAATVTLGGLSVAYDGLPHAVTATTVPAGLAVAFTYNGSATVPSAAGSYAVVATVTDPNYTGSATGTLVIAAPLLTTTTSLSSTSASPIVGANVTLSATVKGTSGTPTGTVTFLNGTSPLGTGTLNGSGVATFTTSFSAAGTDTLTAQYGGDANFTGSTSSAITETVVAVGLAITVSPNPLILKSGASGTLTFTMVPTGGYTGTVNFACGPLPAHVSCTFVSSSVAITTSTTTATNALTINTAAPTLAMFSAPGRPFDSPKTEIFSAVTLWLPGSLLALFGLKRAGRSGRLRPLLMLSVFALTLAGVGMLSGCGTSGDLSSTTPAGNYSVPITLNLGGGSLQSVNATVIVQ